MGGMSKSVRLYQLVQFLSSGKHYLTASALAQSLGVTERTIYRDIIDLDRLGYSIYNDRGYKLLKPESPRHIPITPSDISTLKKIIEASPLNRLPYMKERSGVILAKISACFCADWEEPAEERSFIETIDSSRSSFSIDIGKLEKAINKERVVSILYHSLDEPAPSKRVVHPYVITIRLGNWYLIAFTPEKNDLRQYRLERIQALTIQKETFQRDPDFDLQEYFSQSFGVFRGEPVRVKLRLSGKAARLASERPWPKDMELNWISGDTAILQVTLQGTQEITAWVLSLRDEAEVLEPEALRTELKSILEDLRIIYKVG